MSDPLVELMDHLAAGRQPPLEWCVQWATDGSLQRAIAQSYTPRALADLALRAGRSTALADALRQFQLHYRASPELTPAAIAREQLELKRASQAVRGAGESIAQNLPDDGLRRLERLSPPSRLARTFQYALLGSLRDVLKPPVLLTSILSS